MRIIGFILTSLIQLAFAAAGFVFLLLGMNGYSESDATPGLILYMILAIGSAIGLGLATAFVMKRLIEKKSVGGLGALAVAVLSFSVLGGVILAISFIAALVFAEVMRGAT